MHIYRIFLFHKRYNYTSELDLYRPLILLYFKVSGLLMARNGDILTIILDAAAATHQQGYSFDVRKPAAGLLLKSLRMSSQCAYMLLS